MSRNQKSSTTKLLAHSRFFLYAALIVGMTRGEFIQTALLPGFAHGLTLISISYLDFGGA
jgi:hypothetical protein